MGKRRVTAAEVLRVGFVESAGRILEHEDMIRGGADVEGVHQARVGARRLRSDLRTYASLLDDSWTGPLRSELAWFAGELGAARDLDVLCARLGARVAALPADDQPAGAAALARLDRQREQAQAAAVATLDTERYAALRAELVVVPPAAAIREAADERAIDVLPPFAARAFRHLRKAVDGLGDEPGDDALHRVRIRAKRARYAAEVTIPVVGKQAVAFAKAAASLQGVLGDQHDRVVAADRLRHAVSGGTKVQAYGAGLLAAEERREAAELRDRWRRRWKVLDRAGREAWLDG